MANTKFHFVDDYRNLVRSLIGRYPLREAMSRAVGGDYAAIGEIQKQLLIHCGLKHDHTLIDVGCGSGRLAKALVPYLTGGRFFGTDVVQDLLDYARRDCPPSWEFVMVEDLRIPFADDSADFASFFSIFTHLLHQETYCYLLEARRVVRPGGRIVFSFLEFPHNWETFESMYRNVLANQANVHLNMFIGRDAIEAWARHLDLAVVELHAGTDVFIPLSRPVVHEDGRLSEGLAALGQSVCVLANTKPARGGLSRYLSKSASRWFKRLIRFSRLV